MNYFISFLVCIACTAMAALGQHSEWYWLVVSDVNVAVFLYIAYQLEKRGFK